MKYKDDAAAVLLVDHQSGLVSLVQDFSPSENFGDVDSYGALYLNEKWNVRTGRKRFCRTCLTIARDLKPGVSNKVSV
ncbi:MAG TPA: hypothetical protein VJ044_07545 [Candidatus Hodarchaeales archaeon]|nr:hypothetical protein [Candidatus Hodarchaeales archaeon]